MLELYQNERGGRKGPTPSAGLARAHLRVAGLEDHEAVEDYFNSAKPPMELPLPQENPSMRI